MTKLQKVKVTMSLTGTKNLHTSTEYNNFVSKSLDFDASIYSYCEISGTLNFTCDEVGTDSFTVNRDVIVYNAVGEDHYMDNISLYLRFKFDSSNFYIQIKKGMIMERIYRLTSSNITAIFYN